MRIDSYLNGLECSVCEIEDAKRRHDSITEYELVDISLDWDDIAGGVLPLLLADAEAGKMSPAQIDRLDALLSRLRNVVDALTHFDLAIPARMERETRQLVIAA